MRAREYISGATHCIRELAEVYGKIHGHTPRHVHLSTPVIQALFTARHERADQPTRLKLVRRFHIVNRVVVEGWSGSLPVVDSLSLNFSAIGNDLHCLTGRYAVIAKKLTGPTAEVRQAHT